MSYKIFLSHANEDTRIAQAVRHVIEDAYRGEVEVYLAHEDLVGGVAWKEELKHNLDSNEAIITIVTEEFLQKPWLYIEWTPFWLAGKKSYILLTNTVEVMNLISPMTDVQVSKLTEIESVKQLFKAIHKDANIRMRIPYNFASQFVEMVKKAIEEQIADSYHKYHDSRERTPLSDRKRCEVAKYFYQKEEFVIFEKIVREIRDEQIKNEIALEVLNIGDLKSFYNVTTCIKSAERLGYLVVEMIDHDYVRSQELRMIIDTINARNQAEVRKIAIHLIEQNLEYEDIFSYICDIMTNMAEVRKIAALFLEKNRYDNEVFLSLSDKIAGNNIAELRKLAMNFIYFNLYESYIFSDILKLILLKNPNHANSLFNELKMIDKQFLKRFVSDIDDFQINQMKFIVDAKRELDVNNED